MSWITSALLSAVAIGWICRRPTAALALPKPLPPKPSDSSELETLRTQLRQTQIACQMAQESAQFKAGFLARTAHELRSPLSSVMSLQQLILSDLCEDPAEERETVAQAYEAAQKLLALLDQLIGVSKAVYGTEPLKLKPVSLEDSFMEIESLLMLPAQNRRQQLVLTYPDAALQVMADPIWLRQVLVSLIDTPMRLMQEGKITVTPQVEADRVYIQITDERPAAFWSESLDLPQQLSQPQPVDTLSNLPSGGLSLLTSQMILEQMGGSLELLSVPSETDPTTQIRCVLPLVKPG
jgi:signal transduction histidine kinase